MAKRIVIDIETIKKVKNGDNEAIIKVYDYYKDKISRYILKKYPKENVDDNVSDILLKVFENIDSYSKDKASFNTWVLAIAKNHMIDKNRKSEPVYTNFGCTDTITLTASNSGTLTTTSHIDLDSVNFNLDTSTSGSAFYFSDTDTGIYTNSSDTILITTTSNTTWGGNASSMEDNYIFTDMNDKIKNEVNAGDYYMMTMKYVEGYSYSEIGSEFNISSEDACNKVNNLKNKLRKKIKKKG